VLGNYVAAVHAVRSLAGAGFHVILGTSTEYGTAQHSRHCHEVFAHPPIDDEDAFLEALDTFVRSRPDVAVILPLLASYVACLASHPDRMPDGPVIALAEPATVLTCLDKDRMLAMATELGVPVRRSLVAHDLAELEAAASSVGFPLIVKSTGDRYGLLPGRRKAIRSRDMRELREALPDWPSGHPSLVVQPWVSGPRHNVNFAARGGRLLVTFDTRAPRTDRVDGTGFGVRWDLVRPDERLTRATEAMVARLGYTGVGATQFLVPERGEPHFLELNPRVGMPARVWAAFGFDTVHAACQLAGVEVGWREDPGYTQPVGPHGAWTSREAYGLLTAIGRSELGGRDAVSRIGAMIRTAVTADVHLTWSVSDPLPSLAAWSKVISPGTLLAARRAARPSKGATADH
jgi:predicted ATP-grasp superfamily ATP-dependent carboligase